MEPISQDSTIFYSSPESSESESERTLFEDQQQLRAERGLEMMAEEVGPSTSGIVHGDASYGAGNLKMPSVAVATEALNLS